MNRFSKLEDADQAEIEFHIDEVSSHMEDHDYQRDFFHSLCEYYEENNWLSEKQRAALGRMYERVSAQTSPGRY